MPQTLRYGAEQTFQIDLPTEVLLADCSSPDARPLDDPAAAIAAALADPLDFPPLSRATVSGDRIAVVLEPGLPQVASLAAGVVHALLDNGSEPSEITMIRSAAEASQGNRDPRSLLPGPLRDAVKLVSHDPKDPTSLAYLATSKAGKPIYVNRAVCDADVILPIGVFRLNPSLDAVSVHAGLFPAFSDEEAVHRFGPWDWPDNSAAQRQRREALEEAAWLLGVQFTVQVIPGRGDSVLHILAGDACSVASRGRALCEAAWRFEVPRRASLVVATIEGGEDQQTWPNFARALLAASRAVADDGAIVICSELKRQPGPALRRVASTVGASADGAGRQERADPLGDLLPASVLARTRQCARVYLLSGLEGDVVEEMGLGYVSRADEIARLSRQHDSCILVASAQHAVVVARDD